MGMAEYIEKWSVVNRLIDLENEFQQYKPFHGFEHAMYRKICEAEIAIGKTQTADAAPVRHGRVIETIEDGRMKRVFSCCGTDFTGITCWMHPNYCPNCGAKMDEVSE